MRLANELPAVWRARRLAMPSLTVLCRVAAQPPAGARGWQSAVKSTSMTCSVSLSIRGDVERPACLTLAELRSLMDAELVADFHCREGWSRPGERWRGVRLRTLLTLAGAADAAGYVTVGSGEYTAVLTREQAEDDQVLLALEHEGAASPRPAGFPRLIGPSEWDCFLSVKSVDRIEVTHQPQQATAAAIALARLERS